MSSEVAPGNDDFRMGIEPDYPEPPIEELQGMSKLGSDKMNRNQTIREAAEEQAERNRLVAEEDQLRQRYGTSGFKDAADEIRARQRRRRRQD